MKTNKSKFLDKDTELEYIVGYQVTGDKYLLDALVESSKSYIHQLAYEHRKLNDDVYEDLIQEGICGLVIAIGKFEPENDVRLLTYAAHWIRAYMLEYLVRNHKTCRVVHNQYQRKLFFNLHKYRTDKKSFTREDIQRISDDLCVPVEDVVAMEQRLFSYDVHFDQHDPDSEHYNGEASIDDLIFKDTQSNFSTAEDECSEDQYHFNISDEILNAVSQLSPKQQTIIKKRWLEDNKKNTLSEIGIEYKISAERVRQLEGTALRKLRHLLAPLAIENNIFI